MLDDACAGAGLPTTGDVEFQEHFEQVNHAARLKVAHEHRPMRLAYAPSGAIIDLNEADDEAARAEATAESRRRVREGRDGERAVGAEAKRQHDEAVAERTRRELPDSMEITTLPSREDRTDQIHVLLGHRLFAQPGGFEGVLDTQVLPPPHNLSVADGADHGVTQVGLGGAELRPPLQALNRKHAVIPDVPQFLHHDAEVVEGVDPVLNVPTHGDRPVHLADVIECALGRPPIDVGVPELGHRIQASVGKRVEHPAHYLQVLLRHRPPSIPRGGGGRWRREMSEPADRRVAHGKKQRRGNDPK
ncbi:MAG TPA: hypothetical protein VF056_15905 [Thermoleophilaceae bacterium]